MNKILKGLTITVILLFIGVAFAPSINADVDKLSVESVTDIEVSEEDNATPIALVFQLIAKLRNHKDIQEFEENIDSVDNVEGEILRIIEGDEELNSIAKQLSGEDCGCEDESLPLEWNFPVICLFLFPLVMLFTVAHLMTGIDLPFYIMMTIGSILNCMWQL